MITTQQFSAAIHEECRIVNHLVAKLAPRDLDHRPSPGQRSTLELLRYLATCAIVPATYAVTAEWSHRAPLEAAAAKLRLEDIPGAMTAQAKGIDSLIRRFSDRDWYDRRSLLPWGVETTLGDALISTALRGLVAYRMQLFLYAKASGRDKLGTFDCWLGMDPPAAAET